MAVSMADMVRTLLETCFGEYNAKFRRTEEGLRRLLQTKYNGNVDSFRDKFFDPTLKLFETLKSQGFPLVTPNYQLVHLVSPDFRFDRGDMFFQVGHSNPGTLSLKFTKYDYVGNVVRLQNSHIPEKEYQRAFTDQYLQSLRDLASESGKIGDMLMRTCVVLTKDGAVSRVETSKVMKEMERNVISDMTAGQKLAIAKRLDKEPIVNTSDHDLDDWVGLATRLETEGTLEEGCVAKLETNVAPGSPTVKLLEILGRRDPRYPVSRLLDHLRQMRRNDAVEAFSHADETRRKDWQKQRAQTVNLGDLHLGQGIEKIHLPTEETGSDRGLPDGAEWLHSDAEGNLEIGTVVSKLHRSNTLPTSVHVEPVSSMVPTHVPAPLQQVPNTVPTSVPEQQVPITIHPSAPVEQASNRATNLPPPQQVSHLETEAVTADLHANETPSSDLLVTPAHPSTNALPNNPTYPSVEAAVADSSGASHLPEPTASHDNLTVTSQTDQTISRENANNPSYPDVSDAVTGTADSAHLQLETGNNDGTTGMMGHTAAVANYNQEYPPADRAVQSN